jgi:hypothetical protein
MKKALIVLALAALLLPTLASATDLIGWITDDHCGAKGANADHVSCAKKCLDQGGKLVFFNNADQKLYNLDNQKLAEENLGHEVVVIGTVDGNNIKVDAMARQRTH